MPYVFQSKRKDGNPHPRWKYQYTDWQGKRCTATGSTSRADTEREALREQIKQDEIRKGLRPAPKVSDAPREFDLVVAEYMAWGRAQGGRGGFPWGRVHARNKEAWLRTWKRALGFATHHDLIGCLPRVEKHLRELLAKPKGKDQPLRPATGKTKQNMAEALASFAAWCVERGYLDSNPLARLTAFDTTPVTTRRALTADEIRRLLEAAAPHRRMLYEVAFLSGLRVGELRALTVDHLDTKRGGLLLDPTWTKNRKRGFQVLPRALVERLAESAKQGLAATQYADLRNARKRKGPPPERPLLYVPRNAARDLEKDLIAAGMTKYGPGGKADFHACRVAYVTFILESGASVKEAQTLARHSAASLTLDTYGRASQDRLAAVAESVANALNLGAGNISPAQRLAVGAESLDVETVCTQGFTGSTPIASTSLRP
ncbi:MAG: hypothetical protein AMXMBFR7_46830 [Planctomycetota bacterium]